MEEKTRRFLELMEKQNRLVASLQEEQKKPIAGEDPIRVQREEERREKWGQLRAREHTGRRSKTVHRVFPYVNLSE